MVVFPVLVAPLPPGASVAVGHAETVKRMPIHVKHATGLSSNISSGQPGAGHTGPCEEPGTPDPVAGVPTPLYEGQLEVTPAGVWETGIRTTLLFEAAILGTYDGGMGP